MKLTFSIPEQIDIRMYQAMGIDIRKALFFDIETTGFSSLHTTLYLIGACYYEESSNTFQGIQWFNEDGTKEQEMLVDFLRFATSFSHIIHYNGDGFDLPYLAAKAQQYQVNNTLLNLLSVDIYKYCKKIKPMLALDHIKQKNIETFLGIMREDTMDGGKLIKVYQSHIQHPTTDTEKLLLLHNSDDIRGLLKISPILSYYLLLQKQYTLSHLTIKENVASFTLSLHYPLQRRISLGKKEILFTAYQDTATLRVPVYAEELKFFYPNYKDYYYLPLEDTAMHKSIAFYVDKEFRTQAKAATCYSKKTGMFLPQYEEIVSPYFKKEYKDSITYFELTEEICQDVALMETYTGSILAHILK